MSKLSNMRTPFFLLCGLLSCVISPVLAFEGDYIWDERFKINLVKAESGQASDQYTVGDMYFRGRGTLKDYNQALFWFLLAAEQGHPKAAYKVGYLYLQGEQVEHSPVRAQAWFQKAALAGYAPAQYELGRLFLSGALGKPDRTKALKWLGKAKAADYAPAEAEFTKIVSHLVKAQPGAASSRLSLASKGKHQLRSAALTRPDLKQMILRSQWGSREGPSTFLPSALTQCRDKGVEIECRSIKQDMQLASTRVVYRTQATITDISPGGQFRLT